MESASTAYGASSQTEVQRRATFERFSDCASHGDLAEELGLAGAVSFNARPSWTSTRWASVLLYTVSKRVALRGCGDEGSGRKDSSYSAMFQTYKKVASLAVATFRPALRVARFRAERIFSLKPTSSVNGTLMAAPALRRSRSLRIVVTMSLCFPLRP